MNKISLDAEVWAARRVPKRRRRIVYVAAALLLAGGLGIGFQKFARPASQPVPLSQPAPALTVTSTSLRHTVWPRTIEASGSIEPWQEASIDAGIGGYAITDVLVNVGDQVKKGQPIAHLDPALLQADAAQLQANDDQAEANARGAQRLTSGATISSQALLQYVTQAKLAASQLAAKQLQLQYTTIVAPDDGVISARTATLGAVVSIGQELFRLIRQNRLEWRGLVTAPQLSQLAAGEVVSLSLPDGTRATARIRQTSPSLDSQTRLGTVYADILSAGTARAGMYAGGTVTIGQANAAILPAAGIVVRDGHSYVLKLGGAGPNPQVTLTPVTVGRRQGSEVEILDGLADDDVVVTQGAGFLDDGDVVRVAQSPVALKTEAKL